jgi:hypothetical protein
LDRRDDYFLPAGRRASRGGVEPIPAFAASQARRSGRAEGRSIGTDAGIRLPGDASDRSSPGLDTEVLTGLCSRRASIEGPSSSRRWQAQSS